MLGPERRSALSPRTTGCAPNRAPTKRSAPRSAAGSVSSCRRAAASCAAGNLAGRRARGALRGRRGPARRDGASTGSPPGIRAPTSPRPCSTGSRPRPGAGRCSDSRRAAARDRAPAARALAAEPCAPSPRTRAAVPRRPQQRAAALRPQPDPERGPAGARRARPGDRGRPSPRPGPSSPRKPRLSSRSPRERSIRSAPAATRSPLDAARARRAAPGAAPACAAAPRRARRRRGRSRSARERAAEIMRLAEGPEGGVVELGGGLEATHRARPRAIRARAPRRASARRRSRCPGSCRFGDWELRAELAGRRPAPPAPEAAALDPAALGAGSSVRGWREGDRMRPLGLGGSKSLQDLFTDRKVPRSLRRTLPVVTSGERIAWIAGRRGLGGVRGSAPRPTAPALITARCRRSRLHGYIDCGPWRDDELIGDVLVTEEDLQRRVARARAPRSAATTRAATLAAGRRSSRAPSPSSPT